MNKTKIVNDPVHGFITISLPLIHQLIEHRYLQRLRNIKQLGLTYLVYPGACHNRFQHALGAMHLMDRAIETLRAKKHEITEKEREAALAAILLHDLGHSPFSHALEYYFVAGLSHERISLLLMEKLNSELDGRLDIAIEIFKGTYHKSFLNDLVSSQLDVDRLDYLRRDSFFSGVVEGMIGVERLINMMDVVDSRLVIEAKAIYSIEKFLISRRLMYWQVYLHKTVLSSEQLIQQIMRRIRFLSEKDKSIFMPPALAFFLKGSITDQEFIGNSEAYEYFVDLTDSELETSIKVWVKHQDKILSILCKMMLERKLFRTELQNAEFDPDKIERIKEKTSRLMDLGKDEIGYFVHSGMVSNKAYTANNHSIFVKYNDGSLQDIFNASDMLSSDTFDGESKKHMLCYPKYLDRIIYAY